MADLKQEPDDVCYLLYCSYIQSVTTEEALQILDHSSIFRNIAVISWTAGAIEARR